MNLNVLDVNVHVSERGAGHVKLWVLGQTVTARSVVPAAFMRLSQRVKMKRNHT